MMWAAFFNRSRSASLQSCNSGCLCSSCMSPSDVGLAEHGIIRTSMVNGCSRANRSQERDGAGDASVTSDRDAVFSSLIRQRAI